MKTILKKMIQCCINNYKGKYGKIKKVFDVEKKFKISNVSGVFGKINSQKNTGYLVMTGSNDLFDWIFNLMFWLKKIPYKNVNKKIKVSIGLIEDYKKAQSKILDWAKNFKKIIVTGHSRAGALAILAAVDIQYHYQIEIECYPFANQKVGNKAFNISYNKRIPQTIRTVFNNDLISRLPPFFTGLVHSGKLNHLKTKSNFFQKLFGSKNDHYPQKYRDAIEKM